MRSHRTESRQIKAIAETAVTTRWGIRVEQQLSSELETPGNPRNTGLRGGRDYGQLPLRTHVRIALWVRIFRIDKAIRVSPPVMLLDVLLSLRHFTRLPKLLCAQLLSSGGETLVIPAGMVDAMGFASAQCAPRMQ